MTRPCTSNVTHAFSGSIRLDNTHVVQASLTASDGIELEFRSRGVAQKYLLAFDDAEHLAALMRDLALIVRTKAGIGMTEVA